MARRHPLLTETPLPLLPGKRFACCLATLDDHLNGGQPWKVRAIVEKVFADWAGTLYVYEEYVPEGK